MASSALRSAAGFALVAVGSLLVLLATERHAQRAIEALPPPPKAPPLPAPRAVAVADERPASRAIATARPSASIAASAAPSASASAAPAASGSAAPAARTDAVFRFAPGGITLPKEEIARLVAFAADLRRETGKIVLEGFPDEAGTEERIASLGRRRAVLARQILTDVGLENERLTVAIGDVASDAKLAGAVRIRTAGRTP